MLRLKHPLFPHPHKNYPCFCRNHLYGFRETRKSIKDIKIVLFSHILLLTEYYLILNIPLSSKRTKAGPALSMFHYWAIPVKLLNAHIFTSHHLFLPIIPSDFLSILCLKVLFIFLLSPSLSTFFPWEPKKNSSQHSKHAPSCSFLLFSSKIGTSTSKF